MSLAHDVRHAIRSLIHARGFTLIAGLTLALGIGANAAVFAVVNGVLLRPLPFSDPDRLVRLWSNHVERELTYFSISAEDYEDWRRESRVLALAAYDRQRSAVLRGDGGRPEEVITARASAELFPLLGIDPVLGRTFSPDEALPGGERVAVVADGFWRDALGADRSVLGRSLVLDGESYTVIGVMPAQFGVPGNPAVVWTPLALQPGGDRGNRYLRVLGRVAPGFTEEDAVAEMRAVTARLAAAFPGTNAGWRITISSMNDVVVGPSFERAAFILMGVVGFVLLIACANVANLMLVRAAGRKLEAAVRLALGASQSRVMREWLAESAILGLLGGIGGVVLGTWAVALLRASSPGSIPRIDEISVDPSVIAFTIAVSVIAGLALGIAPALQAARAEISSHLREGGRGLTGSRRVRGTRDLLLVAEVSLALVLLIGTGLLVESFLRLQRVRLGFEPEGLMIAPVVLPESRYSEPDAVLGFFRELEERAARLPGVQAVSSVSSAPFAGPNSGLAFVTEAEQVAQGQNAPDSDYRAITPGYFDALEIPLRRGRDFNEGDRGGPQVVIISESMARQFFAGKDPLGQRLRIGDVMEGPWRTIVGIVADARYQTLEGEDVRPMMYLPHRSLPSMTLVLRAAGEPDALAESLRAEIAAMDDQLAPGALTWLSEAVSFAYARQRFQLVLFGVFAVLALVLASIGIYGVTAYAVTQRRRELGVRMALGAQAAHLRRLVVAQGLTVVGLGTVLGLAASAALAGLMSDILFETKPLNPVVFGSVAVLLLFIAAIASYVPARRATRIDPLRALRDAS